ncbi:Clavaminate synthase-like protein [Punctularia strigosozonata HHB-11173 SS5]|uniref:Clavaminate synthase-like protein n=1 Tax=Punctularia strigosozonata (strain HHB-11173) TaxID=741275 RepID=UPI0004416E9E|nr:Clavaminate synthase-like protein [Punctularia strigosozonata HHB-11173 SS5]EIN12314.1 Clavaminate synthase-like protein [Punctularia strigosozonata HHB-11173 SS5]
MPGVLADIPKFDFPPESQKEFDYAKLETLDLSVVTGDEYEQVPESVVKTIGDAFTRDGFIYATGHGLNPETIQRQFSIAQYAFDGVSEEDKTKYAAKILEEGDFTGYKPRGHWQLKGVRDQIEHFSLGAQAILNPDARERVFPPALRPLVDEIAEFNKYNHDHIYRKILSVLSLVLKLPPTYLWNLAKDPEQQFDLFRYALYHPPSPEEDSKTAGVRLQGHTDFNSVSLLYSQPIVSLQVLMPDNVWRFVRHVPNALVINLGDALHFLSGGFLKPTIHRVVAPPDPAQVPYRRIGVFYFAQFSRSVRLAPLSDSPVASSTGKTFFNGGKDAPTAWEWETSRVKAYGQNGAKKEIEGGHEEEAMIGGEKVVHYN